MNKKIKRLWRRWRYKLRQLAFPLYAYLKYNKAIWQLVNRKAVKGYREHRPELNETQQRILTDLQSTGIAVSSLDELFNDQSPLVELQAYVQKRLERTRTNHKKPFLEDLLPEIPELGMEIPFFKLAIDTTIVDVVNSYLGMHSKLTHFMLRRTKLANGQLPSHSQNWHRSPQERKNCRVYLYLSEVTEDAGPFTYIPNSTHGKKYGHIAVHRPTTKGYLSAEIIENKVPKSDQQAVCGPAGTIIFCDTTGLHRGGYSMSKSRIMSTFGYSAPSFRENIHYSYPQKLQENLSKLSPAVQSILRRNWQR